MGCASSIASDPDQAAEGVVVPRRERRVRPPVLAGVVLTHVGPGRGRRLVQRQVEVFAAELGTEVLACIPISDRIGGYLSTQGHHYRPAAERVARLVEARRKTSNAVSV